MFNKLIDKKLFNLNLLDLLKNENINSLLYSNYKFKIESCIDGNFHYKSSIDFYNKDKDIELYKILNNKFKSSYILNIKKYKEKKIDIFEFNSSKVEKFLFINKLLKNNIILNKTNNYLIYFVLNNITSFVEIIKYKNIMKYIIEIFIKQFYNYIENRINFFIRKKDSIDLIILINKIFENNLFEKYIYLNYIKDEYKINEKNEKGLLSSLILLFREDTKQLFDIFEFKKYINMIEKSNVDYKFLNSKQIKYTLLKYIILKEKNHNIFIKNLVIYDDFIENDFVKDFILSNKEKYKNIENIKIQHLLLLINQTKENKDKLNNIIINQLKNENNKSIIQQRLNLLNKYNNVKEFIELIDINLYMNKKLYISLIYLTTFQLNDKDFQILLKYIIKLLNDNLFELLSFRINQNNIKLLVNDFDNLENINKLSFLELIIKETKSTKLVNILFELANELNIDISNVYKNKFYYMFQNLNNDIF